MSKLEDVKVLENPITVKRKEEHKCSFAFPEWTKEEYLDFVREWKDTYRIHSEHARLEKRFRKHVHNVITPKEGFRYAELHQHPSFLSKTFYNGLYGEYSANLTRWENPRRARFLLAIRKAGKVWSSTRREPRPELKTAA